MLNLTEKERLLLEDQKSHEEACVKKYTKYANEAEDPALKQMFLNHANKEREHYDTINQILSGQVPTLPQGQGQQGQQNQQNINQNNVQPSVRGATYNQKDADLCKDLLMTEKYISGTYNTTIFECRDTNLRQVLNHIQKEEQQHGEDIFNYMQSKGMYNVQ